MERYTVIETDEGFAVFDSPDERIIGDTFPTRVQADMAAFALNTRRVSRLALYKRVDEERARQDAEADPSMGAAQHLAVLTKKTGDIASTLLDRRPRERQLEQELVEILAVALRWLEDLDAKR
jgi:hypothetical protein